MKKPRICLTFRQLRHSVDLQPFEIFLALLCMLSGLPLLLNGPGPGTIESHLPPILVNIWAVELVLGGFLTLLGLAFHTLIEKVGLQFLCAATLVYAIIIARAAWPDSIVTTGILLGFSLACMARIRGMDRTITFRVGKDGKLLR